MKKKSCFHRLSAPIPVLFFAGLLFTFSANFVLAQPAAVRSKTLAPTAIDPMLLNDRGPSSIEAKMGRFNADEMVRVIVQMAGDAVGKVAIEQGQIPMSGGAQNAYAQALTSSQTALANAVRSSGGVVTHRYHRVYNGIAALVRRGDLTNLARQPGVVAIYRDRIIKKQLSVSVPFIGAQELNDSGLKGAGIKIGIIDTGIDYTHKDFGGPGTKDAYDLEANDPTHLHAGTFPTPKVAGGIDIVGDRYDPGCSASDKAAGKCTDVPEPDSNPIDMEGHGTGMAGIAAGIGVPGKVGHGIAPEATLYAIKIFSLADTRTSDIVAAIEWAVDPNGDRDFGDHLDVINMSLGADSGPSFGPEADAIEVATKIGTVVVASAGNGDDFPYVAGSPANSPRAISVAASQKGGSKSPAVIVNVPSNLNNIFAVHEPWSKPLGGASVTGDLVYVGGIGCSPYPPEVNVVSMIALIDRGTCPIQEKTDIAEAAGAVAAIIAQNSPADPFDAAAVHAEPNKIPAVMIFQSDGSKLKSALQGGSVNVTLDLDTHSTDITDALSGYTSRGPSVPSSVLKPDITAPANVFSAGVGTGDGALFVNGTSSAAPHISGSAALLKQLHPTWSPAEIKVALMNAGQNTRVVRAVGSAGISAPLSRTGAGRVAVNKAAGLRSLAFGDEDTGSLSFGFHALSGPYKASKTITVKNNDTIAKTYTASWEFRDPSEDGNRGVKLSVKPATLSVEPGKSRQFEATLIADPTQIHDHQLNAGSNGNRADLLTLEEYDGWITITDGVSDTLRLPFHFLPRKASAVRSTGRSVTLKDFGESSGKTVNLSNASFYKGTAEVFSLMEGDNPKGVPVGRDPAADIRATGVRVNSTSGEEIIEFAINCWSPHALPATLLSYDALVDTNLDGNDDYDIFAIRQPDGRVTTVVFDLQSGEFTTTTSMFDGDFNSSNVILQVKPSDLGLSGSNLRFNFHFETYDEFGGVDVSPRRLFVGGPPFTYDGNNPRFRTDAMTYDVVRSAQIHVYANRDGFSGSSSDQGLLMLHRNNVPDAEAESIIVKAKNPAKASSGFTFQ